MPDLYVKVMLLKKSEIFRNVNTDDLRLVADKLDSVRFRAGERVFEKDEYGEEMYIILSGKIGIETNGKGQAGRFIAELGPGDCFGEMNLLDDLPRSATAVVIEDVELLKLGKQKLRGLILSYPELSLGMLKALSLKLRKTNNLLES